MDWALSAFFGQLERQGRRQKSFSLVLVNLENDSFYCVVGLMDSTDVVLLSDRGLKEVGGRGRKRRRMEEETKVEYRQLQEFLDIRSVYHIRNIYTVKKESYFYLRRRQQVIEW